jgi:hypothetical protein
VNPDFGRVGQDPAVLQRHVRNLLSGEASLLPETAGRSSAVSQSILVPFTRIGQRRAPGDRGRRSPDLKPDQTTILGAWVSGKANGWTYGGLTALAIVNTRKWNLTPSARTV